MKLSLKNIQPINIIFIILSVFLFLLIPSFSLADNIEAILDSANGASQFSVKDSSGTNEVAHIGSTGRVVTKGCLRVDSTGQECTDTEGLIVDGSIGIGIGTAATAFYVNSNAVMTTPIVTVRNNVGLFQVYIQSGTPEGTVTGSIGDLCVDPVNGFIYVKNTGTATNAGWKQIAFGSGNAANEFLSNLNANVAINSSLVANAASTLNLGSAALPWANLYVDTIRSGTGLPLAISPATSALSINASLLNLSAQKVGVNLNGSVNALNFSSTLKPSVLSIDALNGRVGVGTGTPLALLHVMGNYAQIGASGAFSHITGDGDLGVTNNLEVIGNIYGNFVGNINASLAPGSIPFGAANGTLAYNTSYLFWDNTNHYLGVGTGVPTSLIQTVGGDVHVGTGTFIHAASSDDLYVTGNFEVGGSAWLNSLSASATLGVGTGAPSSRLEVSDSAAAPVITITNLSDTEFDPMLKFRTGATPATRFSLGVDDSDSNKFKIEAADSLGAVAPAVSIDTNGNVSVGTTNPLGRFTSVGGDVIIGTGTFNHGGPSDDLYATGNLEVDGAAWLADVTANNLTVTGTLLQQNGGVVSDGGKFGNVQVGITTDNTVDTTSGLLRIDSFTDTLKIDTSLIDLSSQLTTVRLKSQANALTIDTETVVVDAASHYVGIGTVPTSKLQVSGGDVKIGTGNFVNAGASDDLYVTGNLQVDGSVWLGNASTDNLTVTGTLTQTGDVSAGGATFGNVKVGITTDNTIDTTSGLLRLDSFTDTLKVDTSLIDLSNQLTTIRLKNAANALTIDTETVVVDAASHFVGIGTVPTSRLQISGGDVKVGTGTFTHGGASDDLFVTGNMEVNGTIFGTLSGSNATFGNITVGVGNANTINTTSGRLTLESFTDTLKIDTSLLDLTSQAVTVNLATSTSALNVQSGLFNIDTTNSRIGIGTITPSTELQVSSVNGNAALSVKSNGVQGLYQDKSGNVGVGSAAPESRLQVTGGDVKIGTGNFVNAGASDDLYVTGNLQVDGNVWLGNAATDNLTVTGTLTQTGDVSAGGGKFGNVQVGITTDNTVDTTSGLLRLDSLTDTLKVDTSLIDLSSQLTTIRLKNAANALTIDTETVVVDAASHFVGIGTVPTSRLQISGGDVKVGTGTFTHGGASDDLFVTGNMEVNGMIFGTLSGSNATFGNITVGVGNANTINTTSGRLTLESFTDTLKIDTSLLDLTSQAVTVSLANVTNALNIDADTLVVNALNNRVGIGTNAPAETLQVNGTLSVRTTGGTQGLYQDVSGNVGVGSAVPSGKLQVVGGDVKIGTGNFVNAGASDD
ncbi:MAG: hypothetical protein HQL24_09300, partial [Candidatus Omnitrophica bacterium]|nr:hypothetical protein [Candidatus Omnitrophota bacterium]